MTLEGQMRRLHRTMVVAFHRTLVRPYLYPMLEWMAAQPVTPWLAEWLTWRRVVVIGVTLGLLMYVLGLGPTINPRFLR